MEINRTRRRLNEPVLAPNTVPSQALAPQSVPPHELAQRRRPRSADILDAVRQIDMCTDDQTRKELLDWVQTRYADRGGGVLVGLFATCHLGDGYVDHVLDLGGTILTHYRTSDDVPPPYQPARALVRSRAYQYIEIYDDGQLVPVRPDGSTAL